MLAGVGESLRLSVHPHGATIEPALDDYVIVDVKAGQDPALFAIWVSPILNDTTVPETAGCGDGLDDDFDGKTDCHDPECAAAPECVPGAAAFGAPCSTHADCASASGAPACLGAFTFPAPGYCTRFCNLVTPDCDPGDVCVALREGEGVCLDGCTVDSECAAGFACRDAGLTTKVCTAVEQTCDISFDDDGDGLQDCDDPDCAGTPECQPGTKVVGDYCEHHNECAAVNGAPFCANNNCAESCDPTAPNDCGAEALCLGHPFIGFRCYRTCETSMDCPDPTDGYCVQLEPGYGFAGVCNLPG